MAISLFTCSCRKLSFRARISALAGWLAGCDEGCEAFNNSRSFEHRVRSCTGTLSCGVDNGNSRSIGRRV